jgi:hypothetical protein
MAAASALKNRSEKWCAPILEPPDGNEDGPSVSRSRRESPKREQSSHAAATTTWYISRQSTMTTPSRRHGCCISAGGM